MKTKSRIYITLIIVFIFSILALGSEDSSSSKSSNSSSSQNSSSSSSGDNSSSQNSSTLSSESSSNSSSSSDSSAWNKTAGDTNGKDWAKMTSTQKNYLINGVIQTMKEKGYKVDVDASWFIEGLNSFYGSSATDNTSVAEAVSLIGISGKVVHEKNGQAEN